MINDTGDALEQYRKTYSIIFGRATSSQLRYLQASMELQQSLLTSSDSKIAKQISWLEEYTNKKKINNKSKNYFFLVLEPFSADILRSVEAYMAMVSF